jgi:phenylalanyl-tRNA synthetase beta chain
MKLSLAWIFDHLQRPWTDFDVHEMVKRFNTTTAEIERIDRVTLNLSHFFLAQVVKKNEQEITVFCPELSQEFNLSPRADAHKGLHFLLFVDQADSRWAMLADWRSEKEGLMPAVAVAKKDEAGGWKKQIEAEDYILQLDNKSITHRPDLWCHRGIAREIGAMYGIQLVPEKKLLAPVAVDKHEFFAAAQSNESFTIRIKNPEECKRFAAGFISHIEPKRSIISIASRLARIESRPIDAIVDATNYVMFDIGQPMHAFDAQKIASSTITVQRAHDGQTIELLDRQKVTLTSDDLVVTNGKEPLALAGIMGGAHTAVSESTGSLFIEAGNFNAGIVRKTALRVKKRTESSARFEKSLDGANTIRALQRFLMLLKKSKIGYQLSGNLLMFGHEAEPNELLVDHTFIERRLGCSVDAKAVVKILQSLGFVCSKKKGAYRIAVPSFRSSKEPMVKEDIVEEVGRYVGYNTIPLELPLLQLAPASLAGVFLERKIRNYFSYALRADEVVNYALFDELFLLQLNWQPHETIALQNPLSQHWQRLVTSLVPHLLKNFSVNKTEHEIRLYEINRVWGKTDREVTEKKMIAGICGVQKAEINFYQFKDELEQFFLMLGIKNAVFKKPEDQLSPWYHPYKSAQIYASGKFLGSAGVGNKAFTQSVFDGELFIFEFDLDHLCSLAGVVDTFVPLAKFPPTWLDVSLLVDQMTSVALLKEAILKSDARIFKVELIDFYEKDEWAGKRSVTLRFHARDEHKTLSHDEIDHLYAHVLSHLQTMGATVR